MTKEYTLAYVRNKEGNMSRAEKLITLLSVFAVINVCVSMAHNAATRDYLHGTCSTKGASILPVTIIGCYLTEKK